MIRTIFQKNYTLLLTILVLALFTVPPLSSFAADWQVELTVKTGQNYNRLVLGTDATATNGYDPVWDTLALMGGNGDVEAYINHPEWGLVHQRYHRDIRSHAQGTDLEWVMTVNSGLTNPLFSITWSLATLPQENPILLIDNTTGQQTDMRTASSYDFTYTLSRTFTIRVTETSTCSYQRAKIVRGTPVYFDTLQDAYNAAGDGETIQSRAEVFDGDLNINLPKAVTFTGGYSCDYSSNDGETTIAGNMNISNGSVSIEKLMVQ